MHLFSAFKPLDTLDMTDPRLIAASHQFSQAGHLHILGLMTRERRCFALGIANEGNGVFRVVAVERAAHVVHGLGNGWPL